MVDFLHSRAYDRWCTAADAEEAAAALQSPAERFADRMEQAWAASGAAMDEFMRADFAEQLRFWDLLAGYDDEQAMREGRSDIEEG